MQDKRLYNYIVQFLLKRDFVSFRPQNLTPVDAWSDASMFGIAAVFKEVTIARPSRSSYIALNELKAAILAGGTFLRLYNKQKYSLNLFVDNLNVLFLLLNSSCKWAINLNFLFSVIKSFHFYGVKY